jgi:hypothetical protein
MSLETDRLALLEAVSLLGLCVHVVRTSVCGETVRQMLVGDPGLTE